MKPFKKSILSRVAGSLAELIEHSLIVAFKATSSCELIEISVLDANVYQLLLKNEMTQDGGGMNPTLKNSQINDIKSPYVAA